ncbi:MAG TPA: hypothetical protein VLD65_03725 [Anaerolineales bacterium]|nr:hypothetical protein [Anaerolineales bacterium]
MTVRRHSEDYFYTPSAEVSNVVRDILSRRPPYIHTHELVKDTVFKTNVKPEWWYLGTEMIIQLQLHNNGTRVVADTKSQWFILGDIGDFYNRYLRDFLKDVRMELQRIELYKKNARV